MVRIGLLHNLRSALWKFVYPYIRIFVDVVEMVEVVGCVCDKEMRFVSVMGILAD